MNGGDDNDNEVLIKGLTPAEMISPKLPLLKENGKRQDDRLPDEIRSLFLETKVQQKSHAGSAYLELGGTKVLCVIEGPKDVSKKIDFCSTGMITVEVVSAVSKVPERMVFMIKEALESVILLDKFPKNLLEINLDIIEDGGSALSTCLTAAGLALIDANVPLFDIPIGATVLCHGNDFYLDPTLSEIESLDLSDQQRNDTKGALITVGYLPSKRQNVLFTMEGKIKSDVLVKAMDVVTNLCMKIFGLVRQHSTKDLSNVGANQQKESDENSAMQE